MTSTSPNNILPIFKAATHIFASNYSCLREDLTFKFNLKMNLILNSNLKEIVNTWSKVTLH